MILDLQIYHLRNLSNIHLQLADCNLFVGKNGSGKTSLLEAVFLLSRGKTFRHHEPKRYITHHHKSCTVWAKTNKCTLAVQKNLDEKNFANTILKFNQNIVSSQSILSYGLPVLPIDPSGMEILEEGSLNRRQLLDWLVFHVKQDFYNEWLSYQRILKQRNFLLKKGNFHNNINEIVAWDYELVRHAKNLNSYRKEIFTAWSAIFEQYLAKLLPNYKNQIKLAYVAGFDEKEDLQEVLKNRVQADIELGYTRVGAHRCDVMVILKCQNDEGMVKEQAVNVLSRGEKKLMITALRLSQLNLICNYETWQGEPIVLIDDIDAELDEDAINILLDTVLDLPCQLIMTSLQNETAKIIQQKIEKNSPKKSFKMFHVEHGTVIQHNPL